MAYSKTIWANGTTPAISASNLQKIEDELSYLDGVSGFVANEIKHTINSASNYYIEFPILAGHTYNITDTGSSGQFTMVTRATKSGTNLDDIGTFRAGETKQFTPTQNASWFVGYANSATSIFVEEAGLEIPSIKGRLSVAESNITTNASDITALENEGVKQNNIIRSEFETVNNALYTSGTARTAAATVDNYKLKNDGYSVSDSNYKLLKFSLSNISRIGILSDDKFQFQSNQNVPASGTQYRIGETFGTGNFILDVPTGATYLIVSTTKSGSSASVYDVTGLKSDISKINSDIVDTNNNVKYTLDETQLYSDNGLQRLNGFWECGSVQSGAINPDVKYRAISSLQHYDRKITLTPTDSENFRYYYTLSNAQGDIGNSSPWYTSTEITLNENTYFYVCIGRITESTSEVIDPNDFAEKVVIDTKVYSEIKSAFGNSEISRLNKPVEQMVYNLAKGRAAVFGDDYTPLEFIHFSDVHQASDLWKRICDYMDEYHNQIPFALHTGDYVKASELQYTDLYAVQSPENGYILNCVGNHDTYADNAGTTTEPASTVFSRLFNHISDWGVTFGSATNAMYYYKDFADEGIRLIVIDQYYWDDAENTWFRNLLDDAITNDLAVITAGHVCSAPLPMNKRVDCTFTTYDAWNQGVSELVIVQNPGFDDILKDFVDGGGEFVCHLSGHFHHDIMGYTENDILNVVIECATNDHAGWCDSERKVGTKGYDCFNIVSVDRSLHTIRLVRVGNNFDFYGREKNVLCYDYLNKQVITNN